MQTTAVLVISKLKPAFDTYLRLPEGWVCTSKIDSQELFIKCASCPTDIVSLIPTAPLSFSEIDDPVTGPTLRPPPPETKD